MMTESLRIIYLLSNWEHKVSISLLSSSSLLSQIPSDHHLVQVRRTRLIAFQQNKKSLTAIFPTTTALTTFRDHFSRLTQKSAPFTTHTIFRRRSQICGQREIPEKNPLFSLGRKKSRGALQSGQFSVVRPHIRGEHGILMIAFGVNFRYELYRPRLLFSWAREGSETKKKDFHFHVSKV